MLESLYQRLERLANWPLFILLCVLFVGCSMGFQWRHGVLGENVRVFDVRFWYTPGEAADLLGKMGERGQKIYAVTQLTLDGVFPFVYSGLIIILLLKLNSLPRYTLLIPLMAAAADLMENITTAYLAWSYKGSASRVAWIAATFTAFKSVALSLSLLLVLAGLLAFLWRRLSGNSVPASR